VSSAEAERTAATSPLESPPEVLTGPDRLAVSVVICAYSERRWQQTSAAVKSALSQSPPPSEVLLVVDYNAELATRARTELADVTVLENDGSQGLSDARNTGLRAATQPVTAFLDDDAEARPGWLASLIEPYSSPDVVATGGAVHPWWPGAPPRWLPPEFYWVVGCSYRGLPSSVGPVRNPIGANMSLQTALALKVGGFDSAVGRVGTRPAGCEETELAIRLTAARSESATLYVPEAVVDHHVGQERLKLSYFLRRCWHEGVSKSSVVRLAGASAGLESERKYVTAVLPAALLRNLRQGLTGDIAAFMRFTTILAGLTSAAMGYMAGKVQWEFPGARPGPRARLLGRDLRRVRLGDFY